MFLILKIQENYFLLIFHFFKKNIKQKLLSNITLYFYFYFFFLRIPTDLTIVPPTPPKKKKNLDLSQIFNIRQASLQVWFVYFHVKKRIDWIVQSHCRHDPYPIFNASGQPGIISIFSHKSKQKTNSRILWNKSWMVVHFNSKW